MGDLDFPSDDRIGAGGHLLGGQTVSTAWWECGDRANERFDARGDSTRAEQFLEEGRAASSRDVLLRKKCEYTTLEFCIQTVLLKSNHGSVVIYFQATIEEQHWRRRELYLWGIPRTANFMCPYFCLKVWRRLVCTCISELHVCVYTVWFSLIKDSLV